MDPIDELDSLSAASPRFPSTPRKNIESGARRNATSITGPINLKYVYGI